MERWPKIPTGVLVLRREQGFGLLPVLILVAIVVAAAVGGVSAFFALRVEAHPPEQTAKFLPDETQLYFSLNLRPGSSQLKKFRDILERFRDHPSFQEKIDDLLDEAEDETGIDLEEDIFPWLGPDIAVGVIDVVGSAIAGTTGGEPLTVFFFGTTDSERSLKVLQEWIDYQRQEEGLTFDIETYRGLTVYSEQDDDQHYALTEDYVLFATDRDLLEDTIDRIEDDDATGSLYTSSQFQKARDALPEPRFSTLYVDAGAIWGDARRQLGEAVPAQSRRQLDDLIPEWVALTGSFMDRGIKLEVSAVTSEAISEISPFANSLAFARVLPSDTMAFVSFALEPDLDLLREQLEDQRIGDLGPEFHRSLSFELGLALDEDAALSDVLDALLNRFEEAFGLNVERDLLSWMTGDLSFALLPTDFRRLTTDPPSGALEAAAFIQIDTEKRDTAVGAMGEVIALLEDALDLQGDAISYGGGEGVVFDLRELSGSATFQPGYLILGDHLIIATTADALELIASINQGQRDALTRESEYSRVLKEVSGNRNPLIYMNIRAITEAVVEALEQDDRREYRENVEPFAGPLRALLLSQDTPDGVSRLSLVLTIE